MLTRKKRIGIDSSPKTSISKNIHLLSKETIHETVNMLSTPTRRNRFMLSNNQKNINDDSPVLSQEPINISWKWNNEGTPIRTNNKSSKLVRRSISNSSPQLQHLQRLSTKRYSNDNQTGIGLAKTTTSTEQSPKTMAEPETNSPRGLYKFQEEMRKIQFDTESDTSCDNFNDKSMTADTGYPTNMEGRAAPAEFHTNDSCYNENLDIEMNNDEEFKPKTSTQNDNDRNLVSDLLDDSDFDQILLTCQIPSEKHDTNANQTNVKKASSAPEIKSQGSSNNSTGSNWMLDDDCFDDLVKDFDENSDQMNTSAKFTRHKSMPQHPQTPTTSNTKVFNIHPISIIKLEKVSRGTKACQSQIQRSIERQQSKTTSTYHRIQQ